MQDEPDEAEQMMEQAGEEITGTLYSLAMRAIKDYIAVYLQLSQQTSRFTVVQPEHVQSLAQKIVLLGGIDSPLDPLTATPEQTVQEWQHMQAIPFEAELAITKGVYIQLRERTRELLEELARATEGFLQFDPAYITAAPHMLPLLQRLANIPSKAQLKKRIGNASDNAVPLPAAERLAQILNQRQPGRAITRAELLQSIEPTLEGIVRDLVGRILLESIVAHALDEAKVPYKRESEYTSLEGVIYNFRADFIIPDEKKPKAFIEVRKSSTRHASLYAKDKMFSAINWKGKNKDLLAVLVVEGPWTAETLRVMAKIFDYVVPLRAVSDAAQAISAYIQGDQSRLKWSIEFSIHPAAEQSEQDRSSLM